MDSSELTTDQPLPVPSDRPSVQGLVRADLEVREQLGRERYGDSLRPHNGRDALRDLYEELIDAAVAAVRAELEPQLRRKDDLIAELRRQFAAADRVRNEAVAEAQQLRNAQGWDPASPQWAVIRAAIAWRRGLTHSSHSDSIALMRAVDDLPAEA